MKLYELWPTTLQMVLDLKKYGTLGPRNAVRANGKTTALLIYAQELQDTLPPSATVMVAGQNSYILSHYRKLFPQEVKGPLFTSSAPVAHDRLYLLVDEPMRLNWTTKEWDCIGLAAAKVITVGKWI